MTCWTRKDDVGEAFHIVSAAFWVLHRKGRKPSFPILMPKVAVAAGKVAKFSQQLDFRCTGSHPCCTMESLSYHLDFMPCNQEDNCLDEC